MPDSSASSEAVATQAPPIAVSDAELERLLDEATSLSKELSEEAGEIANKSGAEAGGNQVEAATPPMVVAEPEKPDNVATPAAEKTKPLPDLLQDPDAATASDPAAAQPESATNAGDAPEASDPPAAPRRSKGIETRDEEIAEKAASPEAVGDEWVELEDAAQEEEPQKGACAKERLAAACKRAVRIGGAVPIGVANGCLMIFVLLDRPFRDVSPGRKRLLGLVALATLLAGIAAWILPDMMNNNPFAEMERHTKIKG